MKVDTMREIDKYAGVPLTFLLSIIALIARIFRTIPPKPDLSRTLFIELSEMGSAIIVDPAMRKLQQEARAELYFVIFKSNSKSLEILNTVPSEHIFRMRSENIGILFMDVIRFIFWCRKKKITTVIDLELFSRFTAILTFFSGALSRVGFASPHDEGLYRGNLINYPVRYNPHVHIAVNFYSLINTALGYHDTFYATTPVHFNDIHLEKAGVNPQAVTTVQSKIKQLYPSYTHQNIYLLNVNASDLLPQRKWLPERFAEIGQLLLAADKEGIVLATGAAAEFDYVANVVNRVNDARCINAAGTFKFEELIPLYSISKLMLTNDSGPAHFAAVTNLKVFVIFGPETPHLYLPLGGNATPIYLGLPCSPCVSATNHRKTSCITRPCISGIPTQMVWSYIDNYLQNNAVIPV
ncbi:MAG: glycosyltransferase family 9 protein [Hydrotalea sp. AMD]|uniref:glycosyltransferase family 9 protein n=1 Tax=Hydrotalea sp. AMD TaxID=2501297 RepID=UPI000941CBF3|nr:glycosyltransferase family 9 protein [Hydrotalea sp. AMD]RWZ86317.1 MAG: glycosyltransferase family 9 protein [Hydrotalea sp. AMD]